MGKPYYITTPIYYPSDKLHIGHSYCTVAADTLARFHRLWGDDVFFLTGTDEHGQKIERRAAQQGVAPQAYVDEIVSGIRELWSMLAISYDDFIRTSEPRHHRVVQEVFRRLIAKGDIYKGYYEGWYCTDCESFWLESNLDDGKCPDCHRPVEKTREESYFFRLSKYQDALLAHIRQHPEFIEPISRRNEMVAFIERGLEDLSVSRTSVSWGIPLADDPKHVAYVWIDALTNYITAAGYLDDKEKFETFWPADLHLVGKEIVRFHTIIWPIILMALELPLPKKVFGHGWLLLADTKMSKSRGNVVDPVELVKRYGLDAVRYYLLREIPFGSDGSYSEESLILRTNVDLANDLGNLLSRSLAMVERFAGGVVPEPQGPSGLQETAQAAVAECADQMQALNISEALAALWRLVGRANKYIEEKAPWELSRNGDPQLQTVLYDLVESLRVVAVALKAFLVETPGRICEQIGWGGLEAATWEDTAWGGMAPGTRTHRAAPLFPRIDALPEEPSAEAEKTADEITLEDFKKVDLRVARVLACEPVKGTDRLYKLELEVGDERRTVVSGLREHYRQEQLIGQTVVLVANLKPAKLRGIESRGMILAARDGSTLGVLTVERPVTPGTGVS